MATTRSIFDALAPGLAADGAVETYLSMAAERIDVPTWGKLAQQAVALLAAHMLTMRNRANLSAGGTGAVGPLASMTAGSMSVSYGATPSATSSLGDTALMQTSFGLDFLALRASLPDGCPTFVAG